MAYSPHALVEFRGIWTDSEAANESWAFGIRVMRSGGGKLNSPDAYIGDINGPIATWWATAASTMCSRAKLTTLKVNNINPDGKYADPVTHFHDYGAGIGGLTTHAVPGDMSTVWSWSTSFQSRGPGSRGRVYPPNCGPGPSSAFYISTANQTAGLTAAKALLSLLSVNSDGDSHLIIPIIASKVNGNTQKIDTVRVGRVIDVQRKRRRQVSESYATSTWP